MSSPLMARLRRSTGRGRATWLTPRIYLFVILFPVAVAVLLSWFVELEQPSAASPVQVSVTGDPDTPSREFYDKVRIFSKDRAVAVALFTSSVADPSYRELHLEAPVGSKTARWFSEGYPRVIGSFPTTIAPLAELSVQNAAGRYLIYGSPEDAESFTDLARTLGYGATVSNSTPISMLLFKQSLLYSVVSCWVLGATSLIAAIFSKSREYAIKRFWGNPVWMILLKELVKVWRFSWPRLLVTSLAAILTLAILHRLPGLLQVTGAALPLLCMLLAATLVTHAAALGLAYYLPDTLSAIRGRVQHLPLMPLSFAIRLPIVLLLAMAVVSTSNSISTLRELQSTLHGLSPAGNAQRISISERAASNGDQQTAIFLGVGNWLAEIDARGQAVISQPMLLTSSASPVPVATLLLVNSAYLDRHPVKLTDQTQLRAANSPSEMTISIPPERMAEAPSLKAAIIKTLKNNSRKDLFGEISAHVTELADQQDLFTYGAQESSSISTQATIRNPIVVTVPPSLLTPEFYSSMAGQGGYLFLNAQQAITEATNNPSIAKYVRWIQPPAKPVLEQYRETLAELLAGLAALIFLAATLLGTSLGISVAYRTELAQQTRIRWLYGWPLWRTCLRAFIGEAVLYVLACGFFLVQLRNQVSTALDPLHLQRQGASGMVQLLAVFVVIMIALISLVSLLRRTCGSLESTRTS